MFSMVPDNCDAICYGSDLELDNKPVTDPGWWFMKMTDRYTGKVYYSYRRVAKLRWFNINVSVGFKAKPSHFTDGVDNGSKGFTRRLTPYRD